MPTNTKLNKPSPSMKSPRTSSNNSIDVAETFKKLARVDYSFYCEYTHYGSWKPTKHHMKIAELLEEVCLGNLKRVMFFLPPRHGKCLPRGTSILMSDGTRKNIEDVYPLDMVISLEQTTYNIVSSKVLNNFNNGVKPVLKITLMSGRQVICTENHPLMTVNGWTNAELLKIGDRLAVARNLPCLISENMTLGYAKILGYLIGDGGVTGSSYSFTNANEDVINDLSKALGHNNWRLTKLKNSKYNYCLCGHKGSYPRTTLREHFNDANSYEKVVPEIIFKANKKDLSDFIGAYFNCDGTVTNCREGVIEFYSVSKQLLADVQLLLIRFGIYSMLRVKKGRYKDKVHLSYRLVINGKDLIKFANEMDVVGAKGIKLKEVAKSISNKNSYPEYNAIDKDWKLYLKHNKNYFRLHGIRIDKKYTTGTDRSVVLRCAELEDNEYLKKICSDDILWEKITNIENIGDMPTYDLEVENTHNFIVEGVFSHNSCEISETFGSFFLGKHPDKRIILVSYGDSLAQRFGKLNRQKINEFGQDLFDISISKDKGSMTDFDIAGHRGGMISVGLGGGITGMGADLLIMDDIVKNKEEAESEVYREKTWNEWQNTLRTRLHPGASIILIMTRWSEDDIAGRLLNPEYGTVEDWTIVNLPAICEEEGDILGRHIGDPLWPEHGYDAKWAADTKLAVGSQTWNALYQQRPSPAEGAMIKRNWWQYYFTPMEDDSFDELIQSWDATFKDSSGSDFVVGTVWGRIKNKKYLVDLVRARMDFTTTLDAIRMMSAKHPKAFLKLIEAKANGDAILNVLSHEIGGCVGVVPKESKIARVSAVSPDIEAGNVFLPSFAPFTQDFVEECASFPMGAYDDSVDSMSMALNRILYHTSLVKRMPKFLQKMEEGDLKQDLEEDPRALSSYMEEHDLTWED